MEIPLTKAPVFWARVDASPTCWEWKGATTHNGYGRFSARVGGALVRMMAHRYSLLLAGQRVPSDMDVDHLCRNRRCVRPEHLEIVDHRTNVLRGVAAAAQNAAKTHCIAGHEFTAANTYRPPGRRVRQCRICQRRREADARRRKVRADA